MQRVLRLLRRALYARPRAHATGGGDRRRSPASGRGRRDRDSAPRPDRQSLPGARRRVVRLRGAARAAERDRRTGAHPLRQPASPARHAAHDWRDARPAEGVPAPPPSGAIGLDARPRPDAPPPHARGVPGARRQPPSRHAGHRALDRYDRRVPGGDGRRLRGDDVADGGGPLPQHVLVQVFAAARTRSRPSGCPTM